MSDHSISSPENTSEVLNPKSDSVLTYFTPPQWVIYGLVILAGLLLRWVLLDMRPYHHDESLHGMYGRYFYDWPNNNYYKYDPMLHGPMLYNSMRLIYASFGDSLWAARIPVCVMGSIFIFIPLLFRRYFRTNTTLVLTAFIALSPTLVYWSRFLREDYWVVSGMLLVLYGFLLAPPRMKALWIFLGICIQWCAKENLFVTIALVVGYIIFEPVFKRLVLDAHETFVARLLSLLTPSVAGVIGSAVLAVGLPLIINYLPPIVSSIYLTLSGSTEPAVDWTVWEPSTFVKVGLVLFIIGLLLDMLVRLTTRDGIVGIFSSIFNHVSTYPWEVCWSFLAAFLVYCWFYSAGFRYRDGIIDGLGGKGFEYWSKHHAMERIEGPFNFHIYVIGWYELPFLVAFLTHVALFYRRARTEIQFAGACVVAALLLAFFFTPLAEIKQIAVWKFFKLKDYFDLIGLFVLLFHAPIVTVHHLLRREYGLAACGYFFTATFFVYSYLGEKVPWLSMYPLIFGLPYLALFFQDYFQRFPVEFRDYPVRRAFLWVATALMSFGIFFILEEWTEWSKAAFSPTAPIITENAGFLIVGAILVICALLDSIGGYLGRINIGRAIVVIAMAFSLRAAIQTNFVYAGKETEYISQVHTTYEAAEMASRIIDEVKFEQKMYKPKVLVTGEATWPLTWYFRNLKDEYRFTATPAEKQNFTYIIQDFKETPAAGDVPDGYDVRKVNLRGWWVPDFTQMTLKKFLRFSINHYPWNSSGFTYTTLLTAKDTSRFINAK